jgi:archaemetzincin
MSRKPSSKDSLGCRDHAQLTFSSTSHALKAGYKQPTSQQRVAAASGAVKRTSRGHDEDDDVEFQGTFPAPLILPDDELALDPSYPPQSLRSWIRAKTRNQVTSDKKTIYLAAPPDCGSTVKFLQKWTHPQTGESSKIRQPDIQHVLNYLEAFYHGLPVKLLPSSLSFTSRADDLEDMIVDVDKKERRIIGLDTHTPSGCKGIRTRPTPNTDFSHQLNLDDLLDAAIWSLPDDAYALMLLVEHDLYEDEEDEFVCGRAYGGSRVAVISTARYHPMLDQDQGIERDHAWPASHCERYLQQCCDEAESVTGRKKKRTTKKTKSTQVLDSLDLDQKIVRPLKAAVLAHNILPSLNSSPSPTVLSGLWLGRVCRTASHELGHCFGIAHCVYYACSMQGSASIIEDARQPPYLCPVDLAKVLKATGADVKERYEALVSFCDQHKDAHLFAGYGAWIRGRLEQIEPKQEQLEGTKDHPMEID